MITLKNIKKVFKTDEVETWALQNVDLEVNKGEFVAVMGPSGCGKSTLLNILGLLDTPTQGTYLLNGKDVSQMSEDERTESMRFIRSLLKLSTRSEGSERLTMFSSVQERSLSQSGSRLV